MKKIIRSLTLLALAHVGSFAQQKSTKPATKPKTTTSTKTAPTSVKAKPKVDVIGAAISKDAKGTVVPLANKEPFKFYTNPDKELLTIEFTDPAFKNSEIAISDNSGNPIKQVQLEGNQTKVNVNTQRWENGIYVIVLTQHTTQQTIMQKIVLNR
jgi:hypothetical protein